MPPRLPSASDNQALITVLLLLVLPQRLPQAGLDHRVVAVGAASTPASASMADIACSHSHLPKARFGYCKYVRSSSTLRMMLMMSRRRMVSLHLVGEALQPLQPLQPLEALQALEAPQPLQVLYMVLEQALEYVDTRDICAWFSILVY